MSDPWLGWFKELQSIAQNGLTYSKDPFDLQRFEVLRELASRMIANVSDQPPVKVKGLFDQEVGAATPKVDVRGVVLREDKMLLVRQNWNGLWTLPGGWADVGLTPSEAVAKEVKEEAGYIVEPYRLLGIYDRDKQGYRPHPDYIYKIFIQCKILDKYALDKLETDASQFFHQDDLPPLYEANTTREQLDRMFELARNVNIPPDLD